MLIREMVLHMIVSCCRVLFLIYKLLSLLSICCTLHIIVLRIVLRDSVSVYFNTILKYFN